MQPRTLMAPLAASLALRLSITY